MLIAPLEVQRFKNFASHPLDASFAKPTDFAYTTHANFCGPAKTGVAAMGITIYS
jgi:hypothetical protein